MEAFIWRFRNSWHRPDKLALCMIVLLTVAVCVSMFLLEARVGFTLGDEGYLWYGVQRVSQGDVPIRDFMSYDPGRYYWAAGLQWLFQADGIVAVRGATMAFVALGISVGALLVWHQSSGCYAARFGKCVVAIMLLAIWATPWWKGYDEGLSVILVASLAWLLTRPTTARFFVHGLMIGLVAVFGRNHGVYGVIACLLAVPLLQLNPLRPIWGRCIPVWVAGVALGFVPILLGLVFDHQFAAAFWEGIRFILFEYKGTNLPLPVPWPWTIHGESTLILASITQWLSGGLFVLLPLFCVVGLVVVLYGLNQGWLMTHAGYVSCVATAIPYLNVAFSRADVSHLAQALCPVLIGLLIFPSSGLLQKVFRWVGLPLLIVVTSLVALPLHPWYQSRVQDGWKTVGVDGDKLLVSGATAAWMEAIEDLARRYIPKGGTLLTAPVWPGVYALLGVKSPVWEIYPLFPRGEAFQDQELARIKQVHPSLVLVYDVRVDGHESLRYANTHPRIWEYINASYRLIPGAADQSGLLIYIPNSATNSR